MLRLLMPHFSSSIHQNTLDSCSQFHNLLLILNGKQSQIVTTSSYSFDGIQSIQEGALVWVHMGSSALKDLQFHGEKHLFLFSFKSKY